MSARDIVLRATACDDIKEDNAILIRMKSLAGPADDPVVPEPSSSVVRADFEGAILIRPCPEHKRPANNKGNHLLVSLKLYVDPHLDSIPVSLINFVTRTVIGTMWSMLLQVAEGVRDGKRPQHQEAIEQKPALYEWIQERIQVLLGQLHNEQSNHRDDQLVGSSEQSRGSSTAGGAYLQG
eukprot:CAMPEP_0198155470 /NCGR_PEP_ID=MMETSP1443-20131203/69153_1 /TAXON_ID=186043 /ORGANISM="Entomoneis sp., Strain CCMP2396" /LENGTH=180 /DNA_ID=CAMNT_0043822221 /DNA_START=729 /DNA_END=1271 /DNA_ORIENTATION=+